MKRTDYLDWDTAFMGMAYLIAMRSKDPHSQVGSVIVNPDNIVVGLGYNGFPRGVSDDKWSWERPHKYDAVVHSEANAIMNTNQASLKDCRLYVGFFTCKECAKLVIQAGIKEVIYCSMKHYEDPEMVVARKLYDIAGVAYRRFVPKALIALDFGD